VSSSFAPVRWPDIDVAGWAPTKRSLHLYAQMLGKLRLVLSPPQPNWMFTRLHLTARGLTTGAMPWNDTCVEGQLDVFSSELIVRRSTGAESRVGLVPARPVAEVYAALLAALTEVGVVCSISCVPQELPDTTPFDRDTRSAEYDPAAVRRWFAAATTTAGVFDRWRAHFFGRSGIQVWWGAFDLAMILFNGRHVPPPTDRGYLMKYDLDAELMNCGLYLGDERTPAFFYGYIFPQPPSAEAFAMAPAAVTWSTALNEWILPYDAVRASAAPEVAITAFLDSLYARCVGEGGWDRERLSYVAPPKT
jgi:hypothetical protein